MSSMLSRLSTRAAAIVVLPSSLYAVDTGIESFEFKKKAMFQRKIMVFSRKKMTISSNQLVFNME